MMRTRVRTRVAGGLLAAATVLTGCSMNPADITRGASYSSSQKQILIEFDTVLTLTDGAEVMVNGVQVGRVKSVDLKPSSAAVTVAIDPEIRIPTGTTAAVRQGTVLGDSFVALETPQPGASGASGPEATRIPVGDTTSPPPLENTLAVLANFVNGGNIVDAQDVLRTVNRSFPTLSDTERVAKIVDIDSASLAARTDAIDDMLDALNGVTDAVDSRADQIESMLAPAGMHYWRQVMPGITQLGTVIPSVGSVFEGGSWLVPMLTQVEGSIDTVRSGIEAVGRNQPLIEKFLRDNLFPFLRKPEMTVVSATSPEGRDILADAEKILRMLGAIR